MLLWTYFWAFLGERGTVPGWQYGTSVRGFAKGWFPKGWFRRMFPRNENRNEGTFAKTTLLQNRPFYLPVSLFGVDKRVVSKRVVLADVPPERKPERGYVRQNHPFTKPPFYLPVSLFGVDKRVVSKRVVSADVPPERKPERGYVRQNHPFTKPPFYLPVICETRKELHERHVWKTLKELAQQVLCRTCAAVRSHIPWYCA